MKPRRIAIFLPRDNDFYRALLPQMCRGFEACGVEASGVLRLLAPAELADYCASTRTEVVLEMNRARADVAGLPREVLHLSWVVDLGGRAVDDFVGSDVTYLFSDAWLQHFTRGTPMRWLPPGTCTHDYPARPHRGGFALGFLGHIPNPWSAAELARDVTGGAGACDFGTLLPAIERLLRTAGDESLSVDGVLDRIDAVCRDRSGHPLVLDPTLAYDITCRVIRHLNRTELTDGALAMHAQLSSQPWAARWRERWLAIWGTPNWSRWPAYAPHYRGWLDRPAAMGEAYADLVAEQGEILLVQLHAQAISPSVPAVRDTMRRCFATLFAVASEHSKAAPEELKMWMAGGMLINVMTAIGANQVKEPWAETLADFEGECSFQKSDPSSSAG